MVRAGVRPSGDRDRERGPGMADLHALYSAESLEALRQRYERWAQTYDPDSRALGRMLPPVVAGFVGRHGPAGVNGPVLDMGCGTGVMGLILTTVGYGPVDGVDLSPGMLAVAESKAIYRQLLEAALGPDALPMPAGSYAVVVAAGLFSPGHAGPEGLDELVRVARSGGVIVFSAALPALDDAFQAKIQHLCDSGQWNLVAASAPFASMLGSTEAPDDRVLVYRVA